MKIQGLYTALVTPFRNGAVDYDRLTKLVEMQISYGVDGISPVGTTGESPTLSFEEHERVIAANSTAEALHLTRHAKSDGADFSLQVAPYYNKPTQEGLYRHFATIADSCDIPIVIYNVPGRSGVAVAPETISRLAKNHNVAGVVVRPVRVQEQVLRTEIVSAGLRRIRLRPPHAAHVPPARIHLKLRISPDQRLPHRKLVI